MWPSVLTGEGCDVRVKVAKELAKSRAWLLWESLHGQLIGEEESCGGTVPGAVMPRPRQAESAAMGSFEVGYGSETTSSTGRCGRHVGVPFELCVPVRRFTAKTKEERRLVGL